MKLRREGVRPQDIASDSSLPAVPSEEPAQAGPVAKELGKGRAFLGERRQGAGAPNSTQAGQGVSLKGSGRNSLFAHQLRGDEPSAEQIVGRLAPVGVKTVDALLQKLPLQSEVKEILAAQGPGGIAFRSFDEMKADLPKAFVKTLERLPQLTARFNPVELYTADDVNALKEDFIERYKEGERFNPTLTYEKGTQNLRKSLKQDGTSPEKVKVELQKLRAEVAQEALAPGDDLGAVMKKAILHKLDDDLSTLDLLEGLEQKRDPQIKAALATKYGRGVGQPLYDAAKVVFSFLVENQAHAPKRKGADAPPPPKMELPADLAKHLSKAETMSGAEFKDAVDWMLNRYYGMYEQKTGKAFPKELKYTVQLDARFSAIDVRDKSSDGPIIGIPDKPRSPKKYLELLRHEVDMHARQSLNGHFMFGFGGGALKVDEETWYEGLAKTADTELMMEMFGDNTNPTLPYYPFAIRMAEEGKSFVEVFEAMKTLRLEAGSSEKMALSNAWNTAYRVFRGHIDTSNPDAYAMPKDQAYLRGWMLQSQLADHGLSHLNEAAIGPLDGPLTLSRFDFGPDDLMFPDVNLTRAYFEEVMRPKAEAEMAAAAEDQPPA